MQHSNKHPSCVIYCDRVHKRRRSTPAFNTTLERVELKQASRNPLLQARFKQAALYTQLSQPPFARNKHPTRPLPIKHIINALPVSQRSGTTDKQCGFEAKSRVQYSVVNKNYFSLLDPILSSFNSSNIIQLQVQHNQQQHFHPTLKQASKL